MSRISVGLIGCGGIGNFHLGHLLKMDDVKVTAVCDILADRAEAASVRMGGAAVYTDYKEMLEKESLDAAFVCVPPYVHPDIELMVIAKKINLFIQKPMTIIREDADRVLAEIEKSGIINAVGFQDRYLNVTDEIISFLRGATTGVFTGAWLGGIPGVYWWKGKATSGAQVVEQNIHIFDMTRLFFGEPMQVTAAGGRGMVSGIDGFDVEEYSAALVTYKNGVVGTILTGCYLPGGARNGLDIYTNKGNAYYSLRNYVKFQTPDQRMLKINVNNDNGHDCDRVFIDAVIKNDQSKIKSPYSDAIKSLKFTLSTQEAIETGKTIIL